MTKSVLLLAALMLPIMALSQSPDEILSRFIEQTQVEKYLYNSSSVIMQLQQNSYESESFKTNYAFFRNDGEFRQIESWSENGTYHQYNNLFLNGMGFILKNREWQWADEDEESVIKKSFESRFIFEISGLGATWNSWREKDGLQILEGIADGIDVTLYFNKATGYLTKSELIYDVIGDQMVKSITEYSDYRSFGSAVLPTRISEHFFMVIAEAKKEIIIEKVYFDAPLPDALFTPDESDPLGREIPQAELEAFLSRVTNGQFANSTGKIPSGSLTQSNTISDSRPQKTTSTTTTTRPTQTTNRQASATNNATTTAPTNTVRPPAEFRTGGYFSIGAGFSIVSSKVEFEPFIGYNIEMYHDAAFHIKGGLSLYRIRGSKPVGPFVNAGLSFFRSGQMNLNFNRSYYNYAWGMSSMIIIESSGSIMNAGFDLSLGNVIPVAGIFSIAPYVSVNPGFLLLSTDGYGFTSYTDPYFNQYRSNTTVKSRAFYIMPEMGVIFNIGSFFVKPSIVFLSPAMNLEISSADFQLDGELEYELEYEHPVKFSSKPFMVSLGFRF